MVPKFRLFDCMWHICTQGLWTLADAYLPTNGTSSSGANRLNNSTWCTEQPPLVGPFSWWQQTKSLMIRLQFTDNTNVESSQPAYKRVPKHMSWHNREKMVSLQKTEKKKKTNHVISLRRKETTWPINHILCVCGGGDVTRITHVVYKATSLCGAILTDVDNWSSPFKIWSYCRGQQSWKLCKINLTPESWSTCSAKLNISSSESTLLIDSQICQPIKLTLSMRLVL